MLDLIDESLEAFFRAGVPLGATEVDVSFEAPDRGWSAKLVRPTVNMFLWDIRRSATRARSGVEEVVRDGRTVRRHALPVVELRYLITAWTSDHGDERALLAGVMRTLLAGSHIPRELLADEFADLRQPSLLMAHSGEEHVDVFRALEGQLKPSISMIVVADIDTDLGRPVGPQVTSLELSTRTFDGATSKPLRRVAGEAPDAIGSYVFGPHGRAKVNEAGRFLIPATAGDELTLDGDPPRTATVPESGGVHFS